jgi:hypothetical protein
MDKILKMGQDHQVQELHGKRVSIITDDAPRMGGVFALITCFISILDGNATVQLHLVDVTFVNCSLNAATQFGVAQKGLQSFRLMHDDVISASINGCSTNEAFVKQIEDD